MPCHLQGTEMGVVAVCLWDPESLLPSITTALSALYFCSFSKGLREKNGPAPLGVADLCLPGLELCWQSFCILLFCYVS